MGRTALFFIAKDLRSKAEASTSSASNGAKVSNPRTIYHAFQERFAGLHSGEETPPLCELKEAGYDAVQLSPAHSCVEGDEWWRRYQPKSYRAIHGLGSEADLRTLCAAARKNDVLVVADLVFNHAQVVASCDEWRAAERNATKHEKLLSRLDGACENLTREHYEEWHEMSGIHWDNANRTTWWGQGEWSTFRPCKEVFQEHYHHLQALIACGVQGFRFDAAKHMEPDTLRKYFDFLKMKATTGFFAYMEVLSGDPDMQKAYTHLGPTTDFVFSYYLHSVFSAL